MRNLENTTALVVGATGTLGGHACRAYIEAGVTRLLVTSRTLGNARTLRKQLLADLNLEPDEVEIIPIKLDVVLELSRKKAAAEIAKLCADTPLHTILMTAGGNVGKANYGAKMKPPLDAPDPESLESRTALVEGYLDGHSKRVQEVYDMNVIGPMAFLWKLYPLLLAQEEPCSIQGIGSVAPALQLSGVHHYAASKAAFISEIISLGRALASERREMGYEVGNAVAINWGFSIGKQNRSLLENDDGSPTYRGGRILEQTPVGRYGKYEEFAAAVVFAAQNLYMFGDFPIDGGCTSGGTV